jgi:hypothetical protein
MGYAGARSALESAKNQTDDPAIKNIAEAIIQLSRVIETDFNKLEREIGSIKTKLR